MDVTVSGMVTLVKLLCLKAPKPMDVTELPIVTLVKSLS